MNYETKLEIIALIQNCEDRLFDSIKNFYKSRNIKIEGNEKYNSIFVIQNNEKLYNLAFITENDNFTITLKYIDVNGKSIDLYTFLFEPINSNCKPYNFENNSDYILSPYINIEYEDINLIEDFINIINSIE